jgi:primosomal protein N' (replication factor Y)
LTLKEDGAGRELICRECGYKTVVPEICPTCHSWHLKAVGLGVEAIEKQLLDNAFPPQSINVISQDEVANDTNVGDLLAKSMPLITVATEIIFKPQTQPFDLTIIVNSDSLLNSTNYLASEELIDCLTQLKELTRQKIILQTFEPQNDFWNYLDKKSLTAFYAEELENRKVYHYPPFAHIVRITLGHKNNSLGGRKANQLVAFLKAKIDKMSQGKRELLDVLGPIPESHSNSQSIFFWEIIIKLNTDSISLRDHFLEGVAGRNINLEIDPPLGI